MKNAFTLFICCLFFMFSKTQATIYDPFQWLENEDADNTLQWLSLQEALSSSYFEKLVQRENIRNKLRDICAYDFIATPKKYGENYLYLGRHKDQNQNCLYLKKPDGSQILLVNPEDFCKKGKVSLTDFSISPDGLWMAYGLSKAGSDWQEWHIKNLQTFEDLPEILKGIKFSSPAWEKESQGLYYFRFNEDPKENAFTTESALYYHPLGAKEDVTIYQNSDSQALYSSLEVTEDGTYILFSVAKGSGDANHFMCKNLKDSQRSFFPLFTSSKGFHYRYFGSLGERLCFITDDGASKGRIISLDPNDPSPENWIEHISEKDAYMQGACFAGNKIVVSFLKDACSQVNIYHPDGKLHSQLPLPSFGTVTSVWRYWNIEGNQADSEFFFPYTSFLDPLTIYCCDAETGSCRIFAKPETSWNRDDYIVKQIYYSGKDGVKIPMFILHKKNLPLNGNNPTLLYGYGGFGISLTPSFNADCLAWLNLGGVYASANIRGGGEYGNEWHRAGKHPNKQTSFDDFQAAASWLHENGYTNPTKLAIQGHSNGGLLVGACLVQRPDLFKAAIIGVAVLDMLRFHHFTVGWAWTTEYGSPDKPEDFAILQAYSPYHHIRKRSYPSTLITTSDHDNRVVPSHSYKFTAALQASQMGVDPILLRVYKETGHGQGKSLEQRIEEGVDLLSFLQQELGMVNLDENAP